MSSDRKLAAELGQLDGVAQARLVRKGEITPRELVQAAISRIEAGNDSINAVVHRRFEQALEEADALRFTSSAPAFVGVPFLLKDGGTPQAGIPQTQGNIALKRAHYTADSDSPLGRRYRGSGLITVGVSNMPEFALLADTQPHAFGPT